MSLNSRGILLAFLFFLVVPLRAATLSVVYPKAKSSHKKIYYDEIIDGIENGFDGDVKLLLVPTKIKSKTAAGDFAAQVEQQNPDMVITLGNAGYKIGRSLAGKFPLVNAALRLKASPNGIADPTVMFAYLKKLAPGIRRIKVVYSPRYQWLIDLAKTSASQMGFTLDAYSVEDTGAAIKQYRILIDQGDNAKDAFWLPPDSISANGKDVLPLLLKAAWEKHLVVFSGKATTESSGKIYAFAPKPSATPVIHSEVATADSQIFDQIIDGIENKINGTVKLIIEPQQIAGSNPSKSDDSIGGPKQKLDMVITLGKTGFNTAKKLKGKLPLVAGDLLFATKSTAGINPIAEPDLMFSYLKTLAPSINQVNVVYSRHSQWQIDLAKVAAAESGVSLSTYLVKDVPAALEQYQTLKNNTDNTKTAFWLPLDPISAKRKVVDTLLGDAWEKHFVVFSSIPQHVELGALFSLEPDNKAFGDNLTKMVNKMHQRAVNLGVRPNSKVKLTTNARFAKHLGLVNTKQQKELFNSTSRTK